MGKIFGEFFQNGSSIFRSNSLQGWMEPLAVLAIRYLQSLTWPTDGILALVTKMTSGPKSCIRNCSGKKQRMCLCKNFSRV